MNEYDDQNNNVNNIGLVNFSFENNSIRIIDNDGEPWFIARDVALALGYSKTADAVSRHCKRAKSLKELGLADVKDPDVSQNQEFMELDPQTKFITERDVYRLIIKSKLGKSEFLVEKIINQVKNVKDLIKALDDFDVPDNHPESYVYAVRETETGRIKLGVSDNPERRVKELQTANSQKLELVAYRKAYDKFKSERALHDKAASHHIRGEWFVSEAEKLLDEEEDDKNLT